jgi:MFS family permease
VVLLGLTSLLTDTASELVFTLVPAFLAARFPDAPVVLGTMEGLAELVASGFKVASGAWADRAPRLKPFVVAGYGIAAAARPCMAWVTRAWHPLLVRSLDRVGKGLRTSPRDTLLAASVRPERRGSAFGFHRAMDHAGAAVGAALAAWVTWLGIQPQHAFVLAAVPGALAVGMLLPLREPPREAPAKAHAPPVPVPPGLWRFLLPVALFGLANATDAFLLLRLAELGAPAPLLPLAWLLLHVVKASVSWPAGRLADRLGPVRVVQAGWGMYAACYVALAWASTVPMTLAAIAFYGLYHSLAEGAERAWLAALVPTGARGRAFGRYHGVTGVAVFVGGVGFGWAWQRLGSGTAFLLAGGLAAVALAVLTHLAPRGPLLTRPA